MSNPIGFNQLFNKGDFQQGLTELKALIASVKSEIDEATKAAGSLNSALGGQLKNQVASLTSSSAGLDTELKKVRADFEAFKQTVASTTTTLNQYQVANDKLKTRVTDLEKKLKEQTEAHTNLNKATKASAINYGQLSQAMIGVASGAALIYRGITMLKEQLVFAVTATIEFEQAMKEVQAISRASADQLQGLTANAQKLGASTEKTATEIAGLQKELAKLGFTTVEIIASSEAIVDLSTATGENLAGSATVAASTLRAFGMDATEMTRVVDVMAGSFVRSGLDLEKFRESVKLVAPIAHATGVELEVTTAALSKLADAGLSGSLAGTALRNLLSEMASPTTKLSQRLGFTVKSSEDLIKAFKQLKKEGVSLAEAVELVDVRARPAFFILKQQAEAVENLTKEYRSLTGEGERIATMMRDTLANDIEITSSAFDALRMNLLEGFIPAMREAAQSTTTFIEALRLISSGAADGSEGWLGFFNGIKKGLIQVDELGKKLYQFDPLLKILSHAFENTGDEVRKLAKEESFKDMMEQATASVDIFKNSVTQINMVGVIDEFKKLSDIKDKTASETERLEEVEEALVKQYGSTAIAIDKITGKKFINIEAIERTIRATTQEAKTTRDMYEERLREIDAKIELNKVLTETTRVQGRMTEMLAAQANQQIQEIDLLREKEIILGVLNNTIGVMVDTSLKGWSVYTDALGEATKATQKLGEEEENAKKRAEEISKANAERAKQLELKRKELAAEYDLLKARQQSDMAFTEGQIKMAEANKDKGNALELEKKLLGERVVAEKSALDQTLKMIDLTEDTVKNSNNKKLKAYQDYYTKITELGIQWQITQIKAEEDTAKTVDEVTKKRFEDGLKAQKKYYDQFNSVGEKETDEAIKFWDDWQEAANMVLQGTAQAVRFLYDNMAIRRENELSAVDRWEEERIRLAGDNAEAIAAIEQEAEQKRKKIKIEQAKSDKKEALYQIAIQTAVNIIRAFGNPLAMIAAGVIGAAQAAIVAARPLPEFYKGTENSPEGFAKVGERGRELKIDGKTGGVSVTPSTETVQYLNRGTVIIPHDRTEQILSQVHPDHNGLALSKSYSAPSVTVTPTIDYGKLVNGFKDAVSGIPLNQTNFDERGVSNYVIRRKSKIELLNKRYRF